MEAIKSFEGGFTVLMALYKGDSADLFIKAVESVLNNILLPNQFIIVIDGPLSSQLEKVVLDFGIKKYQIEFIRLTECSGLANALNYGIKYVRHEWIVRADADDINLPDRFLRLAYASRNNPSLQLIGSNILEMDRQGRPIAIRDMPKSQSDIRKYSRMRCPFNHMSVAYRCTAVLNCGGYPNIYLKEDYGLWALFLKRNYSVENISNVLVHASAGIDMYSRRGGWRYAKSEINLQKLLVSANLKGNITAIFHGIIRAIFFIIPSRCRGFIYINYLRKKIQYIEKN